MKSLSPIRLPLLLITASLCLILFKDLLLLHFFPGFSDRGHGTMVLMMILVSITFFTTIMGLIRKRTWATNTYIMGALPLLLGLVIGLFHLWKFHWAFYPLVVLEIGLVLFTMVALYRIPTSYWHPPTGKRVWWRLEYGLLLFVMVAMLEFGLRVSGFSPGKADFNPYFSRVDSLIVWEDYHADQYGLTHLSPAGAELAASGHWNGQYIPQKKRDHPFSFSAYSVFEDWELLRSGESELPFSHLLTQIKHKPDSLRTVLDKAHLHYLDRPINEYGYRSIPFEVYDTDAPSVLLLGDSFTFGWSARPWFGSFADHLRSLGYVVYNTGITAIGPDQYARAAEVFIPQLKPDFVIVNFFLGNDIMRFPIETQAGQMVYYPTNAGVMMAHPMSEYIPSAADAYQYYLNQIYIVSEDWFSQLCKKTTLGTLFWKFALREGWLYKVDAYPNTDYFRRNISAVSDHPISEEYLLKIQAIAQEYDSQFHCVIIPDSKNTAPDLDRDYPYLFQQIEPVVAPVNPEHYHPQEEHFNLAGHLLYAELLDRLMKAN